MAVWLNFDNCIYRVQTLWDNRLELVANPLASHTTERIPCFIMSFPDSCHHGRSES